jgi:hypothetical protein
MSTASKILWAILTCILIRTTYEVFMTWLAVRSELNPLFDAHDSMFDLCDSAASRLYNKIDPYCRMAKDAKNLGYWYFLIRDVMRRTKWCLGRECSLDVPVWYWYVACAGIVLNPAVLKNIFKYIAERPKRQREGFMRKQLVGS